MRFLMTIIVFLIFFSFAGIGVYVIGPDLSTERFVLKATEKLKNNDQMDKVVEYVKNDPQTMDYIEEVRVSEDQKQPNENDNLAFETTEDAAQTLVEKVGITNLVKMKSKVEDGTMSPEQIIQKLEEDLNEEEMLALKVTILKEFSKQ